jgi:hypothetical protein
VKILYSFFLFILSSLAVTAQDKALLKANVVWTTQSKNSGESMPCGAGDIGLNVWVEKGDVLFYISRSGTFDENNTLLKLGRVRIHLSPNPFEGAEFKQELILKDGYVQITGTRNKLSTQINVWVDVSNPVVHVDLKSSQKVTTTASYESWRFEDKITKGKENNQNSYKWAPQGDVKTFKDSTFFTDRQVRFYHQVKKQTVFNVAVQQQGMGARASGMFNPLKDLVFGGAMSSRQLKPAGTETGKYLNTAYKAWKLKSARPISTAHLVIALYTDRNPQLSQWEQGLKKIHAIATSNAEAAFKKSKKWWNSYWERSFIDVQTRSDGADSLAYQAGNNYQRFRYMLGCNAQGDYPTKFNGGLFTYDPQLTDSTLKFTPDFRNWGGGTHTAQNQRLVYWPMLKSGDADLMKPQFKFYVDLLKNAELRSQHYWGHPGAAFTEQLENFGMPNPAEYGWKRPEHFDKGLEYNAWLEYEWDTVLEFCMMMLETERYEGENISAYLPFIESCLTFFDEHYRYLAKQRGSKALDANGHLVLYPGSAAETYKMAYNSTSTISALKTVLETLIERPKQTIDQKTRWQKMLSTIPPISFRQFQGFPTIAPAKLWERVNNTESPQLYPVFPWGTYGIGKPGLDTAINTYKYDPDVIKFRSAIGWKQDLIFAARLGLTEEAANLTTAKLKDSGRRFPAFWGPGFDWVPDHNWGGSGMIGLQEMLLQTNGNKIYLFPAWPKNWNVHFKLHAPNKTTVECTLKDGKITALKVWPKSREADVQVILK